jgi:glycosyltransferase involved in cell wall biosynthesis
MGLNYYAPYVSGLTNAARLVAERLVEIGWRVAVVTTRHHSALPRREAIRGVDVYRTGVVGSIGKGPVSPFFITTAARLAVESAVVNLHLPMLEAGPIAAIVARRVPVVCTYQCDVALPPTPINRLATQAVDGSARMAARHSTAFCFSSLDYAEQSRVWSAAAAVAQAISPPCRERPRGTPSFRETSGLHVGFLGRIVEEKGVEHLVEAFRLIPDPEARLLVAGDFERVAGGSVVDRVREEVRGDPRIRLLGFLEEERLADFYASLDVFCLPSVNSLEAFGIVQIEAMLAGVPVVASDLPGVRVAVQRTGAGCIVPPAQPNALASAIVETAGTSVDLATVRRRYSLDATVAAYADLFEQVRFRE